MWNFSRVRHGVFSFDFKSFFATDTTLLKFNFIVFLVSLFFDCLMTAPSGTIVNIPKQTTSTFQDSSIPPSLRKASSYKEAEIMLEWKLVSFWFNIRKKNIRKKNNSNSNSWVSIYVTAWRSWSWMIWNMYCHFEVRLALAEICVEEVWSRRRTMGRIVILSVVATALTAVVHAGSFFRGNSRCIAAANFP